MKKLFRKISDWFTSPLDQSFNELIDKQINRIVECETKKSKTIQCKCCGAPYVPFGDLCNYCEIPYRH